MRLSADTWAYFRRSMPVIAVLLALTLSISATCTVTGQASGGRWNGGLQPHFSTETPPKVKVGIVQGEERVGIQSQTGISLKLDGRDVPVPERNEWIFEICESGPARCLYSVCVASYRWDDADGAGEALIEWRQKGYDARLIERGRRCMIGERTIDNRIYFLSISVQTDRAEAARLRDRLAETGLDAWIEEEVATPASGIIVVRDANRPYAEVGSGSIRVVSSLPITIKNVNYGFWTERREDRAYAGDLELGVGKDGKLLVVELVDLETYIAGVVPAEMLPSWPEAALRAQSVAARTETLAKIGVRHIADGFSLCATEHCQAYGGLTRRVASTTTAVEATRGEVLMEGARPTDAVYSLNCGGHTEDVENVWTFCSDPALRGMPDVLDGTTQIRSPRSEAEIGAWVTSRPNVLCAESNKADNFRWRVTYSAEQLNTMVSANGNIGTVTDIVPLERGVSGRLKSVKIIGTKGEMTVRRELAIRSVFGKLFSAAFVVKLDRDRSGKPVKFTFLGAGRGHGVGMCQDGARGMAVRGATYSEILDHYYTGANIVRLY